MLLGRVSRAQRWLCRAEHLWMWGGKSLGLSRSSSSHHFPPTGRSLHGPCDYSSSFGTLLSELCPTCPWDSLWLCLGCHALMRPCPLSTGKTWCTSCHSHGTAGCSLSSRDFGYPPQPLKTDFCRAAVPPDAPLLPRGPVLIPHPGVQAQPRGMRVAEQLHGD